MSTSDDIRVAHETSQSATHFVIEGEPLPRVPFGAELNHMSLMNCPDCNTANGNLHLLGCTVEQCPLCDGCACNCSCCYEKRPLEILRLR